MQPDNLLLFPPAGPDLNLDAMREALVQLRDSVAELEALIAGTIVEPDEPDRSDRSEELASVARQPAEVPQEVQHHFDERGARLTRMRFVPWRANGDGWQVLTVSNGLRSEAAWLLEAGVLGADSVEIVPRSGAWLSPLALLLARRRRKAKAAQ